MEKSPRHEAVLGNFCPILLGPTRLIWALNKQNRQVRRLDGLIDGRTETIHVNNNKMYYYVYSCIENSFMVGKYLITLVLHFVVSS